MSLGLQVATHAIDGARDHGRGICLARARATDEGDRDLLRKA